MHVQGTAVADKFPTKAFRMCIDHPCSRLHLNAPRNGRLSGQRNRPFCEALGWAARKKEYADCRQRASTFSVHDHVLGMRTRTRSMRSIASLQSFFERSRFATNNLRRASTSSALPVGAPSSRTSYPQMTQITDPFVPLTATGSRQTRHIGRLTMTSESKPRISTNGPSRGF